MKREAGILHADADAFFAAVEQRDDPALRGRPVIVGGGVVMAASYEARAFGVRGAMGGTQARRLCPHAIVVRPRFDAYVAASRELFAIFERTAPVVEGLSLEEAFLDVRGLERISGTPERIGHRLRAEVRAEVGLAITVGIATTRVLAKLASRAAKPDGLLVVPAGEELAFLHPLPVDALWGVGPTTARRLRLHGLETVADVAAHDEVALMSIAGRAMGRYLHAVAHARDHRPVRRRRSRRSYGAQRALGRGPHAPEALDATLVALADRVTRRMRRSGRAGRTVTLRLRFADYERATRSRTLPRATASSDAVLAAARRLLRDARPLVERRGVTLVGIAVGAIERDHGAAQLTLPLDGVDPAAVDAAVDAVRERYGPGAVTRATLLGGDADLPWLMPGDVEGDARAPGTWRASSSG